MNRRSARLIIVLLCLLGYTAGSSQSPPPQPDLADSYKADLLLIVAHEDDDTAFSNYLARAVFDEHRRVAVVFITKGDAGDSAVTALRGDALGALREVEARQAMAFFGISEVWFLHAPNTSNVQDVLHALEYWDHGAVLEQLVRLIRLSRPEVVLSMFPGVAAGENHPDHQAAGVLATEAFDLAGDATAFPEQLASAKDDVAGHNPEGLKPWQSKKIYFWSDAFDSDSSQFSPPPPSSPFRKNFLEGAGPTYTAREISPSRHVPYSRLAAAHAAFYESQDGAAAAKAIADGKLEPYETPLRLILGKSLVGGNTTGDVFEAVAPGAIPFATSQSGSPRSATAVFISSGGAWQFYTEFWTAHGMAQLANLLPIPEVGIRMGNSLEFPLLLRNDSASPAEVRITSILPAGWEEVADNSGPYLLRPGESRQLSRHLVTPRAGKAHWDEISWTATANGASIGGTKLRVCLRESRHATQ
jgi:LmbE family N-acetylglucosaminyl deacetylase